MTETRKLGRDDFVDRLRSLDKPEFVAFVADLWEEMGWSTRIDGDRILATRDEGLPEQRLSVGMGESGPVRRLLGAHDVGVPAETDVLVVNYPLDPVEPVESGRIVDADGLFERLLFAIDRDTGRDLCRRHFGRVFEPTATRGSKARRWPVLRRFDTGPVWRGPVPVVPSGLGLVLVILLLALFVGWTPGGAQDPLVRDLAGPPGNATPVGGVSIGSTTTPTEPATPAEPIPTPPQLEHLESEPLRWNQSRYARAVPTCNRSVGEVLRVYVAALRLSALDGTGGLRTAWRFTDARFRPPFPDYRTEIHETAPAVLFGFDRARFGEGGAVMNPHPGRDRLVPTTVSQRITFVVNGTARTLEFVVTKRTQGILEGCWQVLSVYPEADSSPPQR